MLETSQVMPFLPSEDLDRSEQFFREVLGLPVVSRSPFAYVFTCGGANLRVIKVDDLRPQPFTVFGWLVSDLRSLGEELRNKDVYFLRYEGFDQDDLGVWTTPGGDRVAWFNDPDLNVLSLTEFA